MPTAGAPTNERPDLLRPIREFGDRRDRLLRPSRREPAQLADGGHARWAGGGPAGADRPGAAAPQPGSRVRLTTRAGRRRRVGATAAAATQARQRRWEQWPDACPEGTVHFPGGEYAWRPPGEVACGTGFGQGQRPGTLPPTQAVDGECRSVPSSPQVPPIPLNSFAMTA